MMRWRMWKNARLVLAFLIAFAWSLPSKADENSLVLLEQVPANIHHVKSGGYWTIDGDEGFFRVLIISAGVEHVSQKIFIQWVRVDLETGDYKIHHTTELTEFTGGGEYVLQVETSFGDINAFKIDLTSNLRDQEPRRFIVIAHGDGTYSIEPE